MANLAKTAWLVALLACLGVGVGAVNAAPVSKTGEQVFITCSACHLPSGEGIPGAFPSLQSLPGSSAFVTSSSKVGSGFGN